MPNLKVETAEALCSALYQMPFSEFLGEADIREREEHQHWFHLGEKPKDIRVTIARPLPADRDTVRILVEWRNYHADPRNPIKGEQTIQINTYGATQGDLNQPTTAAVLRILEIFKEVQEETGVAGEIAKLVPDSEDVPEE